MPSRQQKRTFTFLYFPFFVAVVFSESYPWLPLPAFVECILFQMTTIPESYSAPSIRYKNRHYKRCCDSPFVIWFRERSGSSYMCSLLHSHPEILCRREDFDLIRMEDVPNDSDEDLTDNDVFRFNDRFYHRQFKGFKNEVVDNPTPQQTVAHMRRIMSQPRKACGFKFKFDIQVASYPEIVDELHWLSRQVRIVLMTRENFLKQAVSRQNMERIQLTQNKANLGKGKRSLPPIELDVPRAMHYAERFMMGNERFLNSVANFAHVRKVVYENLLSDPHHEVREVLKFLGVDPDRELGATIRKATPDRLSEAVKNFDELSAAVAGTALEAFLD